LNGLNALSADNVGENLRASEQVNIEDRDRERRFDGGAEIEGETGEAVLYVNKCRCFADGVFELSAEGRDLTAGRFEAALRQRQRFVLVGVLDAGDFKRRKGWFTAEARRPVRGKTAWIPAFAGMTIP
jgi:hypothetical protein